MDKPEYSLDITVFWVAVAHISWTFVEMFTERGYSNKGVNLEQRIKQKADVRIKDLLRLTVMAALIGCVFLIPAFVSFGKQECKPKYYEVGDYECHDCTNFHGEECLECLDNFTCKKCVKGHYLKEDSCHICAELWAGCVDCVVYQQ